MSKKILSKPHDRYIRRAFDLLPIAQDFFAHTLPPEILDVIDLNTLEPSEKTFIDDAMKQEIADILFKVNIKGQTGYIYTLVEHMSTQDKLLPYRMLRYVMDVMKYHLDTQPKADYLPVVVPMILHTGKKAFKHSLDIFDLFGPNKELAQAVMFKPVNLIDLPQESDETLQRFHWFRLVAIIMKYVPYEDATNILRKIADMMHDFQKNGYESFTYVTLEYMWQVGTTQDKAAYREVLKEALPQIQEEDIMRICDMFQEDVKIWAEKRGLERGLEQGVQKGKREMIQNLLAQNVPIDIIAKAAQTSVEDIQLYIKGPINPSSLH